MLIASDGTLISKSTRRALEDVQRRIRRLRSNGVSEDNVFVGATLESLEAEEATYRARLDEEITAQWEAVHARYWQHMRAIEENRRAAAEVAEVMKTRAPEYCEAVWRERARYDAEHPEVSPDGV
jgi:hypothetical protein